MIADKLRQAILQAAIQGKLTKQLKSDGDARDLLAKIQTEKAKLVKEGKIKKEKALPEITEDEKPFEIPSNWEWVRLADCLDIRDGTHDTPSYVINGIPLVTSKNLNNGKLDFSTAKFISKKDADKINERSNVDDGDIIFAMIGSIGNPVLVKKDREFCIKNVALFKNVRGIMNMQFIFYYCQYFQRIMKIIASGAVQSFVSLKTFRTFLVPLPPLAEQQRIVARIEALLPELDKLAKEETQLETMQQAFPKAMKDSLLQAAIQGKLTKQLKSDGSAKDLLAKIDTEKAKLIKEGKIKKEKALPEITEDEKPFEIPSNWEWVRLGSIINLISGQDMSPEKYNDSGMGIPYITGASNFSDGKILINRWTSNPRSIAEKGDLLITCKGTVGELAFLKVERAHIARQVMSIRGTASLNVNYIKTFLSYYVSQLNAMAKSMIPGISREMVLNATVPLPPLAEQERIVKRLEQLLPLCEELH